MEQEVLNALPLLDEKGELNQVGYAKKLIADYQRNAIKANKFRIKEWDYYLIYNGHYGLALTIADNSYMGLMSASFLDFDHKNETTKSVMTFMPLGKTNFPNTSVKGDVSFKNKAIDISFENDGVKRILKCDYPNFKDGKTLSAKVTLSEVPQDSMVIITPYKEDKKAFYYNQKINCLRAQGEFTIGDDKYSFLPEDSFGGLDWGRGVWTYDNVWYWGSASGLVNNEKFGFNLGYGFGDTTKASENMLFYQGKASKLDRVTFNIPKDENGKEEYLKPWKFTSNDGRFEMDFKPILNRKACTNALVILSDQNQVFGYFTGKAILDDGKVIEVKDFLGFAEKVRNKW